MATFSSGGADIELELFGPTASGEHPAVVVAYGTRGLSAPFGDAIRDFAKALAAEGFVVAIPHYFNRTDTTASDSPTGDAVVIESFLINRDAWIDTVKDCVAHVSGLSDVKDDQVGLLAFSMGGHIGLRLAKQAPTPIVKALVEFFAPVTQLPFQGIGGDVDRLPPVQIHHGDDDRIVNRDQSIELESQLVAAGKVKDSDYELYFYPGEGHGFTSATAVSDSTSRTVAFLKKHM